MRIIFIVHRFPPHIGGIPRRACRIAKGLSRKGHEVFVYTSSYPNMPRSHQVNGVRIERYNLLHPAIARFMKAPWKTMPGLLRVVKRKEIARADIIQTFQFLSFASLVGALLKYLQKKTFALSPVILPYHTLREEFLTVDKLNKKIKAFLSSCSLTSYYLTLGIAVIKYADLLVPQTTSEKKLLNGFGIDPTKVKIIPGSINTDHFKELPDPSNFKKKYSIDSEDKLVLFIGNPSFWKGAHHLILAMEKTLKKISKIKLIMISPNVNTVHRLLEQFGSSYIRNHTVVTGPLTGKSLRSAYAAANVLVSPSMGETFGQVILEAAASGLPIVSTNTGIASDIIQNQKNGLFVRYGDVSRLSNAIIRVLMNEQFKKEANKKRGFILQTYDEKKEIDSYERAYYNIIS